MTKSNLIRTLGLFFGIVLFSACQTESQNKAQDMLLGRWEIRQAFRNGQPTESLDDLYFEFFEDGNMNTNLLGASEQANYEVEDGLLLQRESQIEVDYSIENLNDSLLVLSTQLRDYSFRFHLKKNIQEE